MIMSTVTIPKTEYQKIMKTQRELSSRVKKLEKVFEKSELEVKPSVLKRWDKFSKELDKGEGRYFKSAKELKNHLKYAASLLLLPSNLAKLSVKRQLRLIKMFAVIRTGGKQYRVEPGATINVEKISGEVGEQIKLDDVLLYANGEDVRVGNPNVLGAGVNAEITDQKRGPKLVIFKKQRRQGKQLKKGHRQDMKDVLRWAIDKANKQLNLNRELDIDIQFGDNYGEVH